MGKPQVRILSIPCLTLIGVIMKILFLDIDGVLNSTRSAIAFDGYPYPNRFKNKFDEVAVSLIRLLCANTNTSICLSSTWRHYITDIKKFAKEMDLPIISKTPEKISSNRGEEIGLWLKENKVDKYAIIDDDCDMLKEQLPYFVKVDGRNGLSYENYTKLVELLEG